MYIENQIHRATYTCQFYSFASVKKSGSYLHCLLIPCTAFTPFRPRLCPLTPSVGAPFRYLLKPLCTSMYLTKNPLKSFVLPHPSNFLALQEILLDEIPQKWGWPGGPVFNDLNLA